MKSAIKSSRSSSSLSILRQTPLLGPKQLLLPPLYRWPHRNNTALLRICRRAYHKGHLFPGNLNSHVEWHQRSRGSFWTTKQGSHTAMTSVQLSMQQVCLDSWNQDAWRLSQGFPHSKEVKITIRHSDWWSWEHGAELDPQTRERGSRLNKVNVSWHHQQYLSFCLLLVKLPDEHTFNRLIDTLFIPNPLQNSVRQIL